MAKSCYECTLPIGPGELMHVSREGEPVAVHRTCVPGEQDCGSPRPQSEGCAEEEEEEYIDTFYGIDSFGP